MKKMLIRNIFQFLIGIGLIIALYFNVPGKLFITITIADSNVYNLIYIFNYGLAIIICLIFALFFYKDKFKLKGFVENLVILAILFFISLLFIFIEDFNSFSNPISLVGILFDGIIIPFIKGIGLLSIISLLFILPLYELINVKEEKKDFIILIITSLLFVLVNILLCYSKNYLFHISEGLCFGVLTIYLYKKEGSILVPIIYYGICKTSILPLAFSSYTGMYKLSEIGCSVLYLLVFTVIFVIMLKQLINSYSKE